MKLQRTSMWMLVWCAMINMANVAHACPVCFSGTDANREAYSTMFVFMTLLPLVVFSGVFLWFRKRLRDADAPTTDVLREKDHTESNASLSPSALEFPAE